MESNLDEDDCIITFVLGKAPESELTDGLVRVQTIRSGWVHWGFSQGVALHWLSNHPDSIVMVEFVKEVYPGWEPMRSLMPDLSKST